MYTIASSWTDKTANKVYAEKPDTLIAGHTYVVTGSDYDKSDDNNNSSNTNDNNGNNNSTNKFNGLAPSEDGNWYYYVNSAVAKDFTGLANNEYGWWYVSKGTVDFTYTGQADNSYGTWNVVNGCVVM